MTTTQIAILALIYLAIGTGWASVARCIRGRVNSRWYSIAFDGLAWPVSFIWFLFSW